VTHDLKRGSCTTHPIGVFAANTLTCCNLCLGVKAVINGLDDCHQHTARLIMMCAVIDTMDGPIARHLGGTTPRGAALDSLADLVSFAVAPALLVTQKPGPSRCMRDVAAVHIVAGAWRLARHQTRPRHVGVFEGLPVTAAGVVLAAGSVSSLGSRGMATLATVLSVMMVSRLPVPSVQVVGAILARRMYNLCRTRPVRCP